MNPPSGCRFHPRCQVRQELGGPVICADTVPPLIELGGGHQCACHFRQPGGATAEETAQAMSATKAGAAAIARS